MPEVQHTIYIVSEEVSDQAIFQSPVLYPELGFLLKADSDRTNGGQGICNEVRELLKKCTPQSFHSRIPNGNPQLQNVSVTVAPADIPELRVTWKNEIDLFFPVVFWESIEGYWMGFVPSLQLPVLRNSKTQELFLKGVSEEISQFLVRTQKAKVIRELVWLSRCQKATLEKETISVTVPSPLEASEMGKERVDPEATLRQIATRLGIDPRRKGKQKNDAGFYQEVQVYQRDDSCEAIAKLLNQTPKKSILIVGPEGVGKTSLFRYLVQRRHQFGVDGIEFWETNGSRIVSEMSGFGQWQDRCTNLLSELDKKKAIVHLGNLVELMGVGQSVCNHQSIAAFLQPEIRNAKLHSIAECSESQFQQIEKEEPVILEAFEIFRLDVPNKEQQLAILESVAQEFGQRCKVTVSQEVIKEIYRLHQRYFSYSAVPGRSVQFLRDFILDRTNGQRIDLQDLWARFEKQTGLPKFLLDPSKPLDALETRNWFQEKVIGQTAAVQQVTEMFAKIKANLTTTKKPIASFLFIGPTGVGKTEMAKSIARFIYNSPNRMIRIDMSEYQDEASVQRLIGTFGRKEGLLTGKVRQNPFSVILLDEFEKAHPAFFDLLLQILGEGRLTDIQGRTANFTTSIIVMTSNLGVYRFKTKALGFDTGRQNQDHFRDHFSKEVQAFLKPELYNRIDSVVPFVPLETQAVEEIVRQEISKLKLREGIRFRNLDLSLDPEVIRWIAQKGNDVQFGARPLQRFIHNNVVVPLANQINQYQKSSRLSVRLSIQGEGVRVDVKAVPKKKNESSQETLIRSIETLQDQRRRSQKLAGSHQVLRLRNRSYQAQKRLEKELKISKVSKKRNHVRIAELEALIAKDSKLIESVQSSYEQISEYEDSVLMDFQKDQILNSEPIVKMTKEFSDQSDLLSMNLFLHDNLGSDTVNLLLLSRDITQARKLVTAYKEVCVQKGFGVNDYCLFRHDDAPEDEEFRAKSLRMNSWAREGKPDGPFEIDVYMTNRDCTTVFSSRLLGFLLTIKGRACFPMFFHEKGMHKFQKNVFVDAFGDNLDHYQIPRNLDITGTHRELPVRRSYDSEANSIDDRRLKRRIPLETSLEAVLADCLELNLEQTVKNYVTN